MPVRIFAFIDPHFFQLVIRRERGVLGQHFCIQILEPLFLSTAFRKPLIDIIAKAFGDFAHYPVDRFAFELR